MIPPGIRLGPRHSDRRVSCTWLLRQAIAAYRDARTHAHLTGWAAQRREFGRIALSARRLSMGEKA